METDKMSTASSVGAERRPLMQALIIERRILFACTILVGLCTFLWITAVCTSKWVHIEGGDGIAFTARNASMYFLSSDSGVWEICRHEFVPNATKATFRLNATVHAHDCTAVGTVAGQCYTINEDADDDDMQIGKGVGKAAIAVNREEYLLAHRDLSNEYMQVQLKNSLLHRRLGEYYKKRKQAHVLKQPLDAADQEEKYQQKLLVYEQVKNEDEREIADIKTKVNLVDKQYEEKLHYAESKFDGLQALEKSTGTGLIYSKKGKPIADKTLMRFLTLQRRKAEQTAALRLRYIRVRNAVSELDGIIRKLEKLGPGLYVAQYEQLRCDYENFMNKIEEREDELIKNRNNCVEHNQILAHIREKMHHTDHVIDITEGDLGDAEMEYFRAREDMSVIKNRRDKLRWCLGAERLKAGLLTRKDLLRDYQNAIDEVETMREKKKRLEELIRKATEEVRLARNLMQQADGNGNN
ncbi:coiled-coil domain-containing protein 96-like isoform X1 [Cydia splendana]|uniref:coiled-coil domain-containing protein 96-like isoform X1 n=1 Tax=Cydia splendana TaxID=1100963 RepID=UPI00300C672F